MEGATSAAGRFDHLREHSIGLPQVLFQSITHMAPAAADDEPTATGARPELETA